MKKIFTNLNKKLEDKLSEIMRLDVRSIALMRIAVALVLIGDLIDRNLSSSLIAHYSDKGILKRSDILSEENNLWSGNFFCLHLINSDLFYLYLITSLHLLFGFMLLIGYKTRFSNFMSWILTNSLQELNPFVYNGGDAYLRVILFWFLFLPLSDFYSVDNLIENWDKKFESKDNLSVIINNEEKQRKKYQVSSIANLALIIQVMIVYMDTAVHKYGPAWTEHYTASFYSFRHVWFATDLAQWMTNFPNLLKVSTFLVLQLEFYGPLLLVFPFFNVHFKFAGLLLIFALHFSILFTLRVGNFIWISLAVPLCFVPHYVWSYLQKKSQTKQRTSCKVFFSENTYTFSFLKIFNYFFLNKGIPFKKLSEEKTSHQIWLHFIAHNGVEYINVEAIKMVISLSPVHFLFLPFTFLLTNNYIKYFIHYSELQRLKQPKVDPPTFQKKPKIVSSNFKTKLKTFFVLFLLLLVISWNFGDSPNENFVVFETPSFLRTVILVLRLEQAWRMFSPEPPTISHWYIIEAKCSDGSSYDLFENGIYIHGGKPKLMDGKRPQDIASSFFNHRWNNFLDAITRDPKIPQRFLKWICQNWKNKKYLKDKVATQILFHQVSSSCDANFPDRPNVESSPDLIASHFC